MFNSCFSPKSPPPKRKEETEAEKFRKAVSKPENIKKITEETWLDMIRMFNYDKERAQEKGEMSFTVTLRYNDPKFRFLVSEFINDKVRLGWKVTPKGEIEGKWAYYEFSVKEEEDIPSTTIISN